MNPTDLASVRPDGTAEGAAAGARKARRKRLGKWFFRIWLGLAAGFVLYLYLSYRATGFDSAILRSDALVSVADAPGTMTFTPAGHSKRASLIFIPGAMVEPAAYAPLAHSIAREGHAVILLKLPWRMASSDSQRRAVVQRVGQIIQSSDPSTRWIVAGHSVGGVLASEAARDHGNLLAGMVLIGTSHPRDFDLSSLSIDVTKVSATNDGLASAAEIKANAKKLPPQTHWVVIDGGNHSQFGYYGFQLGDHRATISRSEQQAQTAKALLDSLVRASSADGS